MFSPGVDGIERDLLMLEAVTVSLGETSRRGGETWLLPDGDEARALRLLDKCTVGRLLIARRT